MKWTFGNALIVVSLLVMCPSSFAKQAYVIPGLSAASHFQGSPSDNIYILAESFSHKTNAKKYQNSLRKKINYPIIVIHKHHLYMVVIGPLNNPAEVRKVAKSLLPESKQVATRHHKAPRKISKQLSPVVHAKQAEPHAATIIQPNKKVVLDAPLNMAINHPSPVKAIPLTAEHSQATTATSPGFFLNAGVGESFYTVSGDNKLDTGAGWPQDNYSNNTISDQPCIFLAAGYTFARPKTEWLPYYSLGLKYIYTATTTVSGQIDQYSLPAFRNYNYQYNVDFMTVLATLKADIYRWRNLMPYVTAGLGISNYSTSDYSEHAYSGVTPRVSPAFGNKAANNFSSSIGAGLDYVIQKNFWFNFEINYINYGKVSTNNGVNYATGTGTNYSNESLGNSVAATSVLLGVTFYPD